MTLALKNPKISIVIVVRNAVDKIELAIKSIINQDYQNFELIILDGLSTDGTLEVIQKYANQIAFFSSEKDNGIYDAMNKAIDRCTGKWVFFLGADDELNASNVLTTVFTKSPQENEVLYGNAYYLSRKTIRFGKMNRYKLSKHNFNHQTVFYPINVFNQYRYNTAYSIWADYLLNINLYFKSGYKFLYKDVVISKFNDLGTSGTNLVDLAFETDRYKITNEIFPFDVKVFYYARRAFLWAQKLFRKK